MSVLATAENVRAFVEKTEAEAKAAFAAFAKVRDEVAASGVNPLGASDEEKAAFEKVETAAKAYHTKADELAQAKIKLNELAAADALASGVLEDGKGAHTPERQADSLLAPGRLQFAPGGLVSLGEKAAERWASSPVFKGLIESKRLLNGSSNIGNVSTDAALVTTAREMKDLIAQTGRRFQATTVTGGSATSAGAFIQNDVQAGYIDLLRKEPIMASLLTVVETDSDTVEWVEQTSRTNAAAETAEGVAASESAVAFVVRTSAVKEIPHFIPVTKRAMADEPEIRGIIEGELIDGVIDRLDTQIAQGGGTGQDFEGIYTNSSISDQPLGTDSRADAVHKAITQVLLEKLMPDAIGYYPSDWEVQRLEKDATGGYLFGPPNISGPKQAWGYPAVVGFAFVDGEPLVGAFRRGAKLWIREGVSVSASDSHEEYFTKRMVALLANMRAAFAVQRPAAFCTISDFS